jgi:methyl farnesoate epoxidase / farnesoate epoxidase
MSTSLVIGCCVPAAGPKGIPFFGYLPFLSNGEPVYQTMKKLAKTYGPVAGFYVGPNQPFISVVGPQAVKEALHNDDLNGRPSNSVIIARTFGEKLGTFRISFWGLKCGNDDHGLML